MTDATRAAMTAQKILQLLGLARRAGRLSIGSESSFAGLSGGTAKLALLAVDAGDNTAKKLRDKCAFYHIPLCQHFNRFELGQACGRSEAVVLTVNDPGFAAKITEYAGDINWGCSV